MKSRLISIVLVAALAGSSAAVAAQTTPIARQAVAGANTAVPDPAAQIHEMVRLFRAGNVAGLVHGLVPPSKEEAFRLAYELHRLEPISDDERAKFQEKIARLTSAGAVDDLMAEIEPKLDEARPKVPGALLIGFGAMQIAINSTDSDLSDEQRTSLAVALPSIQRWASSTDFLSPLTMRQALTLLTDAARGTGITHLDQIRELPLDDLLVRVGPVLGAAKNAVRLYGIDLDAIADSLQVKVLTINADKATVRTTVTVFNAPLSNDLELVLVEGRWYTKNAAAHWSMDTAQN